jgi:hypothetical protein
MNDVFSLFEEEAANAKAFDKVSEESTTRLSRLIRQSQAVDDEINKTESFLKDLKAKKRTIDEEDIPSLMEELGVQSLTVDGNKISVEKFVSARIPDDRKEEAFNFLRSIGEADIIKNDVGQDNMAGAILDDLRGQGLEPNQKTHIHPMTLRSWVKNRIESQQDIDYDTFGVYVGNRAVIKKG